MEANCGIRKVKVKDVQTCRLCLQPKVLRKSHLIPAFVYKKLRVKDRKDPNPVIITSDYAGTSSNQIRDLLLCDACEGLFSKSETWMSENGFGAPEKFKLHPAKVGATLLLPITNAIISSYSALSDDALSEFVYFPTSLFWRAAVHSWRSGQHPLVKIELGKYEDQFRRYLLGETPFPNHAALWCHVSPAAEPHGGVIPPYLKNKRSYHQFRFVITGIVFDLFVGCMIPEEILQTCLHRSEEHVVFISDEADRELSAAMTAIRGVPPHNAK